MMRVLVASEVPEEYVPLMLEELELDGVDARAVSLGDDPDSERSEFHVVVIGAGMSGILAGIRLAEAGIPYTIIEKNPGVGGTWWENRYPGCRVDVGNHFYCYSFEPSEHWSEFFARQPELQQLLRGHRPSPRRAVPHPLRHRGDRRPPGTRERGPGPCRQTDPTGRTRWRPRRLISAVGQLNRPKLPDIEGLDTFAGSSVHTAAWDDSIELAGRRVAVIGSGASAFQLVPHDRRRRSST